ncbi:MAG: hypothetical protein JWN01_169 [Patescibacteria group bacterium]|nr:hypothetical protein [Patescibacteria group bacterium]
MSTSTTPKQVNPMKQMKVRKEFAIALAVIAVCAFVGVAGYKLYEANNHNTAKITAQAKEIDQLKNQLSAAQDTIGRDYTEIQSLKSAAQTSPQVYVYKETVPASPTHCTSTQYGINNQFTSTNCY